MYKYGKVLGSKKCTIVNLVLGSSIDNMTQASKENEKKSIIGICILHT